MTNPQPALCAYPPCDHPIVVHDVYPYGERRRCLDEGCNCLYPWLNAKPPMVYASPEFTRHMAAKR